MEAYSQIILASRPKGLPEPGNFRLETGPIPAPGDGQILLYFRLPNEFGQSLRPQLQFKRRIVFDRRR